MEAELHNLLVIKMKQGKNIYKAGKLIKIAMDYDSEIRKIQITGDFFLYPEEGIEKIQSQLVGIELNKEKLVEKIGQIFEKEKLEAYGFTAIELAEAILGACK